VPSLHSSAGALEQRILKTHFKDLASRSPSLIAALESLLRIFVSPRDTESVARSERAHHARQDSKGLLRSFPRDFELCCSDCRTEHEGRSSAAQSGSGVAE
jgi:hypothetical protein